ncbi:hypothetical protein CGC21_11880 [Leishmania donovani]|uniref:Uncharacterized protein n=1 Tax=Leishmania donovani TaxID=5661 RepID=A0A504X0X5_LEIDO|nr:hypothetical protein CGC21_11880 [Leishmania donovani]
MIPPRCGAVELLLASHCHAQAAGKILGEAALVTAHCPLPGKLGPAYVSWITYAACQQAAHGLKVHAEKAKVAALYRVRACNGGLNARPSVEEAWCSPGILLSSTLSELTALMGKEDRGLILEVYDPASKVRAYIEPAQRRDSNATVYPVGRTTVEDESQTAPQEGRDETSFIHVAAKLFLSIFSGPLLYHIGKMWKLSQ